MRWASCLSASLSSHTPEWTTAGGAGQPAGTEPLEASRNSVSSGMQGLRALILAAGLMQLAKTNTPSHDRWLFCCSRGQCEPALAVMLLRD